MESASVRWTRKSGPPEHVGRASDAGGPRAVEDAGVNHGRFHVLVTQELLDRPNIIAVLNQMGGERVPKSQAARELQT